MHYGDFHQPVICNYEHTQKFTLNLVKLIALALFVQDTALGKVLKEMCLVHTAP